MDLTPPGPEQLSSTPISALEEPPTELVEQEASTSVNKGGWPRSLPQPRCWNTTCSTDGVVRHKGTRFGIAGKGPGQC